MCKFSLVTPSNRERFVLASVIFVVLFSQVLLYPGIRFTVEALGATTELDASMWFLVAEFAAFVCFAIVWGATSDRYGQRRPFIIIGAVGGALGYLVLATIPILFEISFDFTHILAVRFIQGAMTIGAFSLAITMLMDLPGGQGANMGVAGIAIGLGTASGAPIGGLLSEIGPLVPLIVAGSLLLAVAPLLLLIEDRAPSSDRLRLTAVIRGIFRQPVLGVPYAFGFVDRLTAGFFSLVGVFYFQDVFGLDVGQTGIMLALFFIPFALLQFPMGLLSDRIGRTIPVIIGSICYGLGIWFVGFAPTVMIAGIGMIAIGVLGALVAPATMALVSDLANQSERGTAMAGFNIFGSLGFLTGFIFGGTMVTQFGYPTAFAATGGLEILIAVLAAPFFIRFGIGNITEAKV